MKNNERRIKEIAKRIEKIKKIEEEISRGNSVVITRLTILKSLCKDSLAMCQFAYEIVKEIEPKIVYKDDGLIIKEVIDKGVNLMRNIIDRSKHQNYLEIYEDEENQLYKLSRKLWEYQNETKRLKWSNVRIISNVQILTIEKGVNCFLNPENEKNGYELGRNYVEKYNPKYGAGILPESLKYIQTIREFWEKYYTQITGKKPLVE